MSIANLIWITVLDKYVRLVEFLIWGSLLNSKIIRVQIVSGHSFPLSFYKRFDAVLSFYEARIWSDGRRLVLIHRLQEFSSASCGPHWWAPARDQRDHRAESCDGCCSCRCYRQNSEQKKQEFIKITGLQLLSPKGPYCSFLIHQPATPQFSPKNGGFDSIYNISRKEKTGQIEHLIYCLVVF